MDPTIDRDPPVDCPLCHRVGRRANGARFGLPHVICVRCYQYLYRRQRKGLVPAPPQSVG